MAFPLLGLLPSILKTVGKVVGLDVFSDAATALQNVQLTPAQQASLDAELHQHEEAMKALSTEEIKAAFSENVAMIQSDDTYTKRARPTALYAATVITAALAVALAFGRHLDTGAITALLLPLWGAGGYYIYSRTQEKIAQLGGNGK